MATVMPHAPVRRMIAQDYWSTAVEERLAYLDSISPLNIGDAVTTARETIEDEIKAARLSVCAMQTRRNALLPISVLPSEVLARVFEFLILAFPTDNATYYYIASRRSGKLGWIAAATHVCRRWRQVAMENPCLWGRILFFIGSKWTEEMLARVKAAPITIAQEFSYHPPSSGPFTHPVIPSRLYQIRELKLSGQLQQILLELTQPAPILERLELVEDEKSAIYKGPNTLQSDFLGGHAPRLREITVRGVLFSWSSFSASALTEMILVSPRPYRSLQDGRMVPLPSTPLGMFLDFFVKAPNLTSLTLEGCLPTQTVPSLADRTVFLPSLSFLALKGPAADVARAMTHIRIPHSAKLRLTSTSKASSGEEYCTILSLISEHLGTHSTHPTSIQTFSIHAAPPAPAESMQAFDVYQHHITHDGIPEFDLKTPPYVSLRFDGNHGGNDIQSPVLRQICAALPFWDLRTLELSVPRSDWTGANWLDVMGPHKSVEHLRVSGIMAETLCSVLAQPVKTELAAAGKRKRRTRESLLFPGLQSLYLLDVNFEEPETLSSALYGVLHSSLQKRRTLKAGPKRLDISCCTFDAEQLGTLEEAVDEVVWDGDIGELESEEEDEDWHSEGSYAAAQVADSDDSSDDSDYW
ncbi:hypothetical protein BV25DRAFT_1827587 [Artomyces pyxidatus]|uniref:Uncharacterized protein n=1 Tax=Artomyces pyxidatus TaxID=48021 RepID=A0ACB8SW51_9AGAM|nr:hypothetical protein BV25DRAFT_1827587 [Artomyces pyxidatus]